MKDPGKECTHRHSPLPQVEVAVCVHVCWYQQSTPAGGSQPAVLYLLNVISPSFKTLSFTACDPLPPPPHPLCCIPPDVAYDDHTVNAICNTTEATAAAFRVISVLCTGSLENLKAIYSKLQELFYTGEWAGLGGGPLCLSVMWHCLDVTPPPFLQLVRT